MSHTSSGQSSATNGPDVVAIGSFVTRYLADPAATGGVYAIVEHSLGAGMLGAPPHRHAREDECSYVLEGTLTVWREGAIATIEPRQLAMKPRGEYHTFWNAGSSTVRFLEVITPGAFAQYFRELGALMIPALAAGKPPDLAAVSALAARYELTFDFPAMGKLMAEHNLRLG